MRPGGSVWRYGLSGSPFGGAGYGFRSIGCFETVVWAATIQTALMIRIVRASKL